MQLKTGNWGGSTAIRLPKRAVEALGIEVGTELQADIVDGTLVIRPGNRRYSLEELLREADGLAPPECEIDEPTGAEWPDQ